MSRRDRSRGARRLRRRPRQRPRARLRVTGPAAARRDRRRVRPVPASRCWRRPRRRRRLRRRPPRRLGAQWLPARRCAADRGAAKAETDQNSVRATTTTVGRGNPGRCATCRSRSPSSPRSCSTTAAPTRCSDALHYTAGITFQAAEGGEEDIRLRGFSLTASGDIYVDTVRDPAFYDRDVFNFDRVEVLRGSASMLFGRGSTGGVVNQVSKQPMLANVNEVRPSRRHREATSARPATSTSRPRRDVGAAPQRDDDLRRQLRQHDRQVRHRADLPLGHRHRRRVLGRLLLPQQRQRHQLRPAVAAPRLAGRPR